MPESQKNTFHQPSNGSEQQATPDPAQKAVLNQDLTELVDDLEEQVAEEHRQEGVPGNRADREQTEPIDTGDRAPD